MSSKDTYHHGNLRRALKDEALVLIAEKGVEGLSLREVASRVGVSHAAPYHHFADRAALVHALAHEGMALMDERMAAAEAAAMDDPRARLAAIGLAYVEFAVERPDYYAAFTAPDCGFGEPRREQPPEPSGDTWGRLLNAVEACQQDHALPPGDPTVLAVYLWSLVHGLAELWRLGSFEGLPVSRDGLRPLAEQVLGAALASMRLTGGSESGRDG
jgi:AcrR family transcriptional regulator